MYKLLIYLIWSRNVSNVDKAVSSNVPSPKLCISVGSPGCIEETNIIPV